MGAPSAATPAASAPASERATAGTSASSASPDVLVYAECLGKRFGHKRSVSGSRPDVFAVDDVSLRFPKGKTLGIVGESGCGKSTLGRMLVGLIEPTRGDVFFEGQPLFDAGAHADYEAFRKSLAGTAQMVFQDPYSSLNPRMRIGESVAEPLLCAGLPKKTAYEKAGAMLAKVGLEVSCMRRYPHEFSGGQRQRVAIARALVTVPSFVVCDEPTSSLDASVQAQVLNLLQDLQEEFGLTYCFISHDLAVVRHMSDRVAVMYAGSVVEEGDAEALFAAPRHPYTALLLDSVPGGGMCAPGGEAQEKACEAARMAQPVQADALPDEGAPLKSQHSGAGCAFAPRCPYAFARCRSEVPALHHYEGASVRCFVAKGP